MLPCVPAAPSAAGPAAAAGRPAARRPPPAARRRRYRGARGTLLAIDEKRFQAQVELGKGPHQGKQVWLEYEDVSKYSGGGGKR